MIKEKIGGAGEEIISYINKRRKDLLTNKELTKDVLNFIKESGTTQQEMENEYPTQKIVFQKIIPKLIKNGSVSHIGNVFYKIKR
jgi:hypothetical protein